MGTSRRRRRRRRPFQEQPEMNKRLFGKAKDRAKTEPRLKRMP